MKNKRLSLFFVFLFCIAAIYICYRNTFCDCCCDLDKAAKIAGFTFPLKLSNYTVRAKHKMIEITYPLDEFRDVTVRKTVMSEKSDISGVKTAYPKNFETALSNGVRVNIRTDGEKIFVMNMVASTGYYSAYCKQGMSMREVEGVYEILAEAEAERPPVSGEY